MHTKTGDLLLDVAELDDISAVLLMAVFLGLAPMLHTQGRLADVEPLVTTIVSVILKLGVFGGLCLLFSRYLEQPLTQFFKALPAPADPVVFTTGTAFVVAALAGLLGLSVALGAFFAGIVLSRDPTVVKMDVSLAPLMALFAPFFFLHVGMSIEAPLLWSAGALGGILLGVAMLSKFLGTALPALGVTGESTVATVLGISMIPRAEIALVVMQKGRELGEWAVSGEVFSAMVMVAAGTCLLTPLALRTLLRRWAKSL